MIRPSFRDPQGRTWIGPDSVLRAAWSDIPTPAPGQDPAQESLGHLIQAFQTEGRWIPATPVDPASLVEFLDPSQPLPSRAWAHPRLFFPSYAHEWAPAMLHQAAKLTLELNERLLEAGWELKDATPTNILFDGPHPIFVDHLSPSLRRPGHMGWTAYGQFIRNFLVPLCLHRLRGLPLAWLHLARRDGISPEDASLQLGLVDRLRPSVLGLITLPALLARRQGPAPAQGLRVWKDGDEFIGRTITARLLKGLHKRLGRWAPPVADATLWFNYDQAGESYTPEGVMAKEAFIQRALDDCRPKTVLDLGCNTGRYSRLAARAGARVVAVDGDPTCIDHLWHEAQTKGLDILPLVMDLGRPSPALGWENSEEAPFLERTEGRFEMVFALALIHHLLVRERIPLDRIAAYLARQTTRWAAF
ncbi:MAG: methyltransferase domain-containing protein [Holophaga sp.]|nr:methyltransferase domain-containing protein [Holophaga sp.]